jgi:hypothetical protein
MSYKQWELDRMNKMELVKEANSRYGLGVNKGFKKADLVQMIMSAQKKFTGNSEVSVAQTSDAEVPPGYVKLRVRPNKYDKTPRPAIIGHNFKMVSIPVNKDVIMPAKYLSCLEDAVQDTYFQDPETREMVKSTEHTYPYSILEWGEGVERR